MESVKNLNHNNSTEVIKRESVGSRTQSNCNQKTLTRLFLVEMELWTPSLHSRRVSGTWEWSINQPMQNPNFLLTYWKVAYMDPRQTATKFFLKKIFSKWKTIRWQFPINTPTFLQSTKTIFSTTNQKSWNSRSKYSNWLKINANPPLTNTHERELMNGTASIQHRWIQTSMILKWTTNPLGRIAVHAVKLAIK